MKKHYLIYCEDCKKVFKEKISYCPKCGKETKSVYKNDNSLYVLYWIIPVIIYVWFYNVCNDPTDYLNINSFIIGMPLMFLFFISIIIGIVITVIMVKKNKKREKILKELRDNNYIE